MFFKKKKNENTRRRLPKWVPKWLDAPLRFFIKTSIALALVFFCITSYFWYQASKYDIAQVSQMRARTIILDNTGTDFASIGGKRRRPITAAEIPEHLKVALYAREDADFETHSGVKLKGLLRAAFRNVKDGKYTQGGSTLSMQLIKNTYDNREKTIYRKLLEIALTYRLENHYEKEDILTHYLNRIYFGSGCYGIEEAAQTYFGKSTKNLNEGESALLVGIIKAPALYNPFKDIEKAMQQRDQVVGRMLKIKAINAEQAILIKEQPIKLASRVAGKSASNSYAMQMVKRHLNEIFTEKQIADGGLTVKTTIDQHKTAILEKLDSYIQHNSDIPLQTAGVIINAHTGSILALNGGYDVKKSPFNIALDGKRSLREAFTPLLFLATVHLGEEPIPKKAVQTGRLIDRTKLIRFCKKLELGTKFLDSEDLYRGDIVTSPLRLATAYCAYASEGHIPHTYIVNSVTDSLNEIRYTHPDKKAQITHNENVAIARSFFTKNEEKKWTFLTIDSKKIDGWAININNNIVTVLWCGHSDNTPMKASEESIKKGFQRVLQELK